MLFMIISATCPTTLLISAFFTASLRLAAKTSADALMEVGSANASWIIFAKPFTPKLDSAVLASSSL